ncbi:MAG: protein phosphatase 2C domain-containing protein [Ruminococcus sp.]|nr:protein phosphatase 2C domain-containing protein [Ruminococcus sp.]
MGFLDRVSDIFGAEERGEKVPSQLRIESSDFADIAIDHMAGRRNVAYYEPCQDYSGYRMFGGKATIAISDGCSSAEEAEAAAKLSVEFSVKYMQDVDWSNLTDNALIDDFIDSLQQHLRNSGKEYEELSATLVTVSFNRNTNDYIIVSIGDGLVFSYDQNYSSNLIVSPFNRCGDTSRTCFGNDIDVKQNIQIVKGNILTDGYFGFAICSDGAMVLDKNREYGNDALKSAAFAVKNRSRTFIENMVSEIQSQKTHDDVAIGIMLTTPNREVNATTSIEEDERNSDDEFNEDNSFDIDELVLAMTNVRIPAQYGALIVTNLYESGGLSFEELIKQGLCIKGSILRTMIPLVKCGLVEYKDGKFIYKDRTEV